jgi:hypothetical protein
MINHRQRTAPANGRVASEYAGDGRGTTGRVDFGPWRRRKEPLLLEQIVERRLHSRQLGDVLCDVGPRLRFEVIAEIRFILFADLLRRRLLAMFGIRRVVLNAHLAHVQLRIARLAHIEPTKRQAQFRERCAAAPAD